MARWFIVAGIVLIVIGVLLYLVPSLFSWFGKLPGDIRIDRGGRQSVFSVTSMIVASIVLTIIINIIRFLRK